jgi:formate/nitrite transporter
VYDLHIDAYSPKEMAERVEKIGVTKAKLDFATTMTLSIMAGAFIAFAAEFFTFVIHDSKASLGFTMLVGGAAFTLGLIMVVVGGAELFTGNMLIIMAYVGRKITLRDLLRNWVIVFFGNFIGALTLVLLMYLSRQWTINQDLIGARVILIANSKVDYSFLTALIRGVLANILVVMAVWLAIGGRSVADKILGMLFPITAFVASGFEHSIANMYFVPMGLLLKKVDGLVALAEKTGGVTVNLERLSWAGFLVRNLIPVTLGNIIGGVVFVGLAYWFVYLRKR